MSKSSDSKFQEARELFDEIAGGKRRHRAWQPDSDSHKVMAFGLTLLTEAISERLDDLERQIKKLSQ